VKYFGIEDGICHVREIYEGKKINNNELLSSKFLSIHNKMEKKDSLELSHILKNNY
jgi:hypothetical protein